MRILSTTRILKLCMYNSLCGNIHVREKCGDERGIEEKRNDVKATESEIVGLHS